MNIKYWKKLNGDCGTMDNNGFVPDSIEINELEYQEWVNKQPIIKNPESDINKLIKYAKNQKWI